MKQVFLKLESSRGIAALIVAVHNAVIFAGASALGNNPLVANGYLMVDFFFVISGFVIAYNYGERITSGAELCAFQFRRFLRLYPLHVTMLAFFVLVEFAKYLVQVRLGISDDEPAFFTNNGVAFLNNLFLTQGLFEEGTTFNGPAWSISVEFYTYLLFALLTLFISNKMVRRCTAIAIVVLSALVLIRNDAQQAHTGVAIFRCTFSFFIGVLVQDVHQRLARPSSTVLLLFASVVAIASVWFVEAIAYPVQPFVFGLLVYLLATNQSAALKLILENRVLVYLGTISYGIYMIHRAVWWVIIQVLQFGTDHTVVTTGGTAHFDLDPLTSSLLTLAAIGIVIALASLSYHQFETRFTRLKRLSFPRFRSWARSVGR